MLEIYTMEEQLDEINLYCKFLTSQPFSSPYLQYPIAEMITEIQTYSEKQINDYKS
jgi:hypothetical protein